ncbi:MAG TPA: hypothetical protein VE547_03185, partial [Mycobacteriales bacterium]|nr:hypothetical protein [Mycobacteriales bacterium]
MTSVRRRWGALLVAGVVAAGCTSGEPAGSPGAPTTPAAGPGRTIDWTGCRLPAGAGALVRSVAAGGDGVPWTAVGQEGGVGGAAVRPAVWTSADG